MQLEDFSNTPNFMAAVASYDGADPVGVRHHNLTADRVTLKLEEDTSKDQEQTHTTEVVNYLAIEGDEFLTGALIGTEETPAIEVFSPNGGETFAPGQEVDISWTDNLEGDVKITLFRGNSLEQIIDLKTESDGQVSWTVPDNLPASDLYRIKINQYGDNKIRDFSDDYFSIEPQPEITVTSPNGGDLLKPGENISITWNDNIDENVDIDLYRDGVLVKNIAADIPSDGQEDWEIPSTLATGDRYQIKISQFGDNSVEDFSDDYFAIEPEEVPNAPWKAEYFNNINLSGIPVLTEDLGDGTQNLLLNWGRTSPENTVNNDNFSAHITTERYLEAGWYQIKAGSDDGIKVKVDDRLIIDNWVDRGFTEDSDTGHFYFNGGETSIEVDYYDKTGAAALNFKLQKANAYNGSNYPSSELIANRVNQELLGWDWNIEQTGDFNGDGIDDVLLRNDNGLVHAWLLNNNAQIVHRIDIENTSWDWNIEQVGDFNGDDTDDILIRRYDGQVHTWLLDNAQIVHRIDIENTSWDWNIEQVGDFNGDDTDDILIRRYDGQVHTWLLDNAQIVHRIDIENTSWDWNIEQVGD